MYSYMISETPFKRVVVNEVVLVDEFGEPSIEVENGVVTVFTTPFEDVVA